MQPSPRIKFQEMSYLGAIAAGVRYGNQAYRGYKRYQRGRARSAKFQQRHNYRARWGTVRYGKGRMRRTGYYGRYNRGHYHQRPELKFHDRDTDDALVSPTGDVLLLNLIAQGTGESQRIGRKITIRKIDWRYTIAVLAQTDAALTAESCRVMLIHDHQCNGVTPTVGDVLKTADYQSFNDLANTGRFNTLFDRTYTIRAPLSGNGTSDQTGTYYINGYVHKDVNINIEFDNTTGAIGEIRSNNIFLLFIAENGICRVNGKARLRFTG